MLRIKDNLVLVFSTIALTISLMVLMGSDVRKEDRVVGRTTPSPANTQKKDEVTTRNQDARDRGKSFLQKHRTPAIATIKAITRSDEDSHRKVEWLQLTFITETKRGNISRSVSVTQGNCKYLCYYYQHDPLNHSASLGQNIVRYKDGKMTHSGGPGRGLGLGLGEFYNLISAPQIYKDLKGTNQAAKDAEHKAKDVEHRIYEILGNKGWDYSHTSEKLGNEVWDILSNYEVVVTPREYHAYNIWFKRYK